MKRIELYLGNSDDLTIPLFAQSACRLQADITSNHKTIVTDLQKKIKRSILLEQLLREFSFSWYQSRQLFLEQRYAHNHHQNLRNSIQRLYLVIEHRKVNRVQ